MLTEIFTIQDILYQNNMYDHYTIHIHSTHYITNTEPTKQRGVRGPVLGRSTGQDRGVCRGYS